MDGITPFPVRVKMRDHQVEWWKLTQDEEGKAGGCHGDPPHGVWNQKSVTLEVELVLLDQLGCGTLRSEPRRGRLLL